MVQPPRLRLLVLAAALVGLLVASAPQAAAPTSWTRVEHDALRGGGHVVYVTDVLPAEAGQPWLAVGYVVDGDGNRHPSAWTSNDGATWRRFEMPETGSSDRRDGPFQVARRGNVAVSVGNRFDGQLRAAAWWSTAASSWSAVMNPADPLFAYDGTIEALDAGPEGFVAVGYRDSSSGTTVTVFRSEDGRAWRLDSSFSAAERVRPIDVASVGTRLVVVGFAFASGGSDGRIWIGEGGTWRSVDPAPLGLSGPGFQNLGAVVWDPALGLVAGGATWTGSVEAPTLWVSGTGDQWERLPTLEGGVAAVHEIERAGTGFLATGSSNGGPRVWRSTNGRDWALVPTPPAESSGGKIILGASDGTKIVFVVLSTTGSQLFHRVGTEWRRGDRGSAFPATTRFGSELRDVAAAGRRVVAVGSDGHGKPLVLLSPSGGAWRKIGFGDDAAQLQAVTADRGLFTIVGWRLLRERAHLALWTSRTGTHWQRLGGARSDPIGAFVDVTPSTSGLLATAFEGSARGLVTTVWGRSRGGWAPVAKLGMGQARAICSGPNGTVVVATAGGEDRSRVLVWSRPPRGAWPAEPEVIAVRSVATRCADGPDGTVIAGSDGNRAAGTWRRASPAGRWVGTVIADTAPLTEILDVIRDGSGFLATGTSGARGQADLAIWSSPNGDRWTRVSETDPVSLEPGYQVGQGIVKARGRVVIVGRHGAGNAGLWTGALGGSTPPPLPASGTP